MAFFNSHRAAISSSECSTVYETPISEKKSGLHYLVKTKINLWTQSESDDVLTGDGTIHLGAAFHPYLLLHKVNGQQEIQEYICKPESHGFQKRFDLVFAPKGIKRVDDMPIDQAVAVLKGVLLLTVVMGVAVLLIEMPVMPTVPAMAMVRE